MKRACANNWRFDYVPADSWFFSVENIQVLKGKLNLNFIFTLKSNRKVALSKEKKLIKEYINIESLQSGQQIVKVWLEELNFPLFLTNRKEVKASGN